MATYTAFQGVSRLRSGNEEELTSFLESHPQGSILVFDDATGMQTDLDARGKRAAIGDGQVESSTVDQRGRGRPRLGVVGKEVTLLPQHWDWLNVQPGGASVALRKLVHEALRASGERDRTRAAQEAAYRFMAAVAGNLPQFEEAARALFSQDRARFTQVIAVWPEDVRDYALRLAFGDQA